MWKNRGRLHTHPLLNIRTVVWATAQFSEPDLKQGELYGEELAGDGMKMASTLLETGVGGGGEDGEGVNPPPLSQATTQFQPLTSTK